MTEVRVRSENLDDGAPVALRDTMNVYDLVIDFSKSSDEIIAALQELFQEAVDTGRWSRNASKPETGPNDGTGLPS